MSPSTRTATQSDLELERRVQSLLASRNYPALRELHVCVHNGQVVLSGCVSTFHQKQLASSCAQQIVGKLDIVNLIDVPSPLPLAGSPSRDG